MLAELTITYLRPSSIFQLPGSSIKALPCLFIPHALPLLCSSCFAAFCFSRAPVYASPIHKRQSIHGLSRVRRPPSPSHIF